MALLDNFRRKKAIKSYIKVLPQVLVKDYGRFEHYTPQQIRCSVERSGLHSQYVCYALAMYTRRPEFETYQRAIGENNSYEGLRAEVGNTFFEGRAELNFIRIVALSANLGSEASVLNGAGDGEVSSD